MNQDLPNPILPARPRRSRLVAGCDRRAPGENAAWRFIGFFTANIRNQDTRAGYARAVTQFFDWAQASRMNPPARRSGRLVVAR